MCVCIRMSTHVLPEQCLNLPCSLWVAFPCFAPIRTTRTQTLHSTPQAVNFFCFDSYHRAMVTLSGNDGNRERFTSGAMAGEYSLLGSQISNMLHTNSRQGSNQADRFHTNLWVQCETLELRFLKCSIKWDVLTFCFSPVSASLLHSFYSLENTTLSLAYFPPSSPHLFSIF
jgi:hypothetical protein